ncbi:hypothetical protein MBANPS3_006105 [Mucor bainieri]
MPPRISTRAIRFADNPVANHHQAIFDPVFDAGRGPDAMLMLLDLISHDHKQDKEISLVHSVLTTLLSTAIDTIIDITSREADYSFYVIWPLCNAIAKAVNGGKFNSGEYYLEAIAAEFNQRRLNNKHHYKLAAVSWST